MSARFEKFSGSGSLPSLKLSRQIRQLDDHILYFYRLVTEGGEVVLNSEGYLSKEHRDKNIAAVKVYSGNDECYERCSSPEGKWFFIMRAGKAGIVGTSINYDTDSAMEAAINKTKKIAQRAVIAEEPETD